MKVFSFLTMMTLAAVASAAVTDVKVEPTGTPAFKGMNTAPIATVTFTATADGTDVVRIPVQVNAADVANFTLGGVKQSTQEEAAVTFTVPVKKGENKMDLTVDLAPTADLGRKLRVAENDIRIGSIVTRGAQEIVDQVLPDGRLRSSKNFRIPGIVKTPQGTLIACFDIRYKHSGDLPADITVGISTSTDDGNTWSPITTAMDYAGLPGGTGVGDATILVDPSNGRVWLMGMRTPGSNKHPIWGSKAGTAEIQDCGQIYVSYSDDEGKTWSAPRNITADLKRVGDADTKDWGLTFQGPGAGIALKDGTLVFPGQIWGNDGDKYARYFDNINKPASGRHGVLFYSKDHGKTWTSSKRMVWGGSESTVAQLDNGKLFFNVREGNRNSRVSALTADLGETWEYLETTPLAQPGNLCQAAVLNMGGKLYFSNPNSGRRDTMTLRYSADDGKTWSKGLVYDPRGCAGYSSLCPIDEKTIGVIYEGNSDYHYFLRVPLEEIEKAN